MAVAVETVTAIVMKSVEIVAAVARMAETVAAAAAAETAAVVAASSRRICTLSSWHLPA